MTQVTFIILPPRGEEPCDPTVSFLGSMVRVPLVDEYVFLEKNGDEYKVQSVSHEFEDLLRLELTAEEASRLGALSEEELESSPQLEIPIAHHRVVICLRRTIEEEERALVKKRQRAIKAAVEALAAESV